MDSNGSWQPCHGPFESVKDVIKNATNLLVGENGDGIILSELMKMCEVLPSPPRMTTAFCIQLFPR